jgi:hypothetical protein
MIIKWSKLPDEIPAHFNGAGEIDRWGNKGSLIFMPVLGWIMYLGIGLFERFPQSWNTSVTVTAENAVRIYPILRNLMVVSKFYVVLIFSVIWVYQLLALPLPGWFLWVSLGLLALMIIYYLVKLNRNK